MNVRLDQQGADLIQRTEDAALLGIIQSSGRVLLTTGDPATRPGHRAWQRQERLVNVRWGFSLLVRDGQVHGLFVGSEINRTPDRELTDAAATGLERALRGLLAPNYRRW